MENIYVVKATGTEEVTAWETVPVGRAEPEKVGKFSYNNGVIAFVDQNRDFFVGYETEELEEELEKRGFQKVENLYVPHSNDSGKWLESIFPGVRKEVNKIAKERHEELSKREVELQGIDDLLK